MNKTKRFAGPIAIGAVVLTFILIFFVQIPCLTIAGSNQKPVLFFPLLFEKSFCLGYRHSVHKTLVEENFSIRGKSIVLISTTFDSLGVGIPFDKSEGHLENKSGRFVLSGLNRIFKEINIKAMPLAEQFILFRGHQYYLNDYFAPGELVRLKLTRYSTAELLWQNITRRKE